MCNGAYRAIRFTPSPMKDIHVETGERLVWLVRAVLSVGWVTYLHDVAEPCSGRELYEVFNTMSFGGVLHGVTSMISMARNGTGVRLPRHLSSDGGYLERHVPSSSLEGVALVTARGLSHPHMESHSNRGAGVDWTAEKPSGLLISGTHRTGSSLGSEQ